MTSSTLFHPLSPTSSYPLGIKIQSATGSYLKDEEGKTYLDLIAGIAVSPLGHGHSSVSHAIKEQVDRHLHVMVYGEFQQKPQMELAEKITSLLPESLDNVFLVNSGTEANEAAIKLAKAYTQKPNIISFKGSYHGSTNGSLSISDHEDRKNAFRPLLPGIEFLPFNDESGLDRVDDKTAAVFIEPIQGDAGVRIPSLSFLKKLRKKCDQTGALLVMDEIQSGVGRTGKWFAFQHFGIIPDILTSAKALGGGMPIGAVISSDEIMRTFRESPPLGHITTFGGHPVSCAASLATIQAIEDEGLLAKLEEKAVELEQGFDHPKVKEVRRIGAMFGIELGSAEEVQQVVQGCLEKGVVLFWFLSAPSSFRIAPPLNITMEEIHQGRDVIRSVLDDL